MFTKFISFICAHFFPLFVKCFFLFAWFYLFTNKAFCLFNVFDSCWSFLQSRHKILQGFNWLVLFCCWTFAYNNVQRLLMECDVGVERKLCTQKKFAFNQKQSKIMHLNLTYGSIQIATIAKMNLIFQKGLNELWIALKIDKNHDKLGNRKWFCLNRWKYSSLLKSIIIVLGGKLEQPLWYFPRNKIKGTRKWKIWGIVKHTHIHTVIIVIFGIVLLVFIQWWTPIRYL